MTMKNRTIIIALISTMALSGCSIFDIHSGGDSNESNDSGIHVTSISLNVNKTVIAVNERLPYTVSVTPSDASDPEYEIYSSDESILWVDDANIIGLKVGTASITVSSFDGDFEDMVTFQVMREEDIDHSVHPESISLSINKNVLDIGDVIPCVVDVLPEETTDKSYRLNSTDSSVIRVENSNLRALKAGSASITAITNDGGLTDSITVSVRGDDEEFDGYAPYGYTLSWNDEFDGNSLNKSYWEPMIGNGYNYGVWEWGNSERQYYKEENATVSGGKLHITAKKETAIQERKDEDPVEYQYTSARLRTTGKVSTTYGYIEARMKLPAGTGMWPAFWMLPEARYANKGWPMNGEIDIMEAKGRILNKSSSALHIASNERNDHVYDTHEVTFPSGQDITDYHCYGLEWNSGSMKFSLDGNIYWSVTSATYQHNNPAYTSVNESAPFDRPFHLLLNLAVGGQFDGGRQPDDSFISAEMDVDYVRIFNKA